MSKNLLPDPGIAAVLIRLRDVIGFEPINRLFTVHLFERT
jgi:hypothetical protein